MALIPKEGEHGLRGTPINPDVVVKGFARANEGELKTLLSSSTIMSHPDYGPAVRSRAQEIGVALPTPVDQAPARIDQLYLERRALDDIGSDPAALAAVKWDATEEEPQPDGTTKRFGVLKGERRELPAVEAPAEGTPQAAKPPESTWRVEVENGVAFQIEQRPDGSEWLWGQVGQPKSTGIMIRGPVKGLPGEGPDRLGEEGGDPDATGQGGEGAQQTTQVIQRLLPGEGVPNEDGSVSTERSITVEDERLNGGRPTNIPTIYKVDGQIKELLGNGQEISEEIANQAVEHAVKTGEAYPAYNTIEEAVQAAQERSAAGGRFSDLPQTLEPTAQPGSSREVLARIVTPLLVGKAIRDDVSRGIVSGTDRAVTEVLKATRLDTVANWLDEVAPLRVEYEKPKGPAGEIAQEVTRFGLPFAAYAKALPFVNGFIRWTMAGALTDATAVGPDEENIADMLKEVGKLDDPTLESLRAIVVEALAKDEDDTEVEKRLKNVGEGLALGLAIDGIMAGYRAVKAIRKIPGLSTLLGIGAGAGTLTSDPGAAEASTLSKVTKVAKNLLGTVQPGDIEGLRDLARQHFRQNLQGTTVEHATLGPVELNGRGADKLLSTSADPDKLRMIPKLPEIIQAAKPAARPVATPDGKETWHYMESLVEIDDRPIKVAVTVREDASGKKFYNLLTPKKDHPIWAAAGLTPPAASELNIFTAEAAPEDGQPEVKIEPQVQVASAAGKIVEQLMGLGKKVAEPFYSKAAKVITEDKTAKAPANQWLATLKNKGVKDEELVWTGLATLDDKGKLVPAGPFVGKKSVTKEQLVAHIEQNQVKLRDIMLGEDPNKPKKVPSQRNTRAQAEPAHEGEFETRILEEDMEEVEAPRYRLENEEGSGERLDPDEYEADLQLVGPDKEKPNRIIYKDENAADYEGYYGIVREEDAQGPYYVVESIGQQPPVVGDLFEGVTGAGARSYDPNLTGVENELDGRKRIEAILGHGGANQAARGDAQRLNSEDEALEALQDWLQERKRIEDVDAEYDEYTATFRDRDTDEEFTVRGNDRDGYVVEDEHGNQVARGDTVDGAREDLVDTIVRQREEDPYRARILTIREEATGARFRARGSDEGDGWEVYTHDWDHIGIVNNESDIDDVIRDYLREEDLLLDDEAWEALQRGTTQEVQAALPAPEAKPDYKGSLETMPVAGPAKWTSIRLGGGKNYRELLMQLPVKEERIPLTIDDPFVKEAIAFLREKEGGDPVRLYGYSDPIDYIEAANASGANIRKPYQRYKDVDQFTDGHFPQPNVLVHVRFDERRGPNGERIMFIQEIQSDWHQKGRDRGYKGDKVPQITEEEFNAAAEAALLVYRKHGGLGGTPAVMSPAQVPAVTVRNLGVLEGYARSQDLQAQFREIMPPEDYAVMQRWVEADRAYAEKLATSHRVPDAPLKGDASVETAFRRMVRMAADSDFDMIAFPRDPALVAEIERWGGDVKEDVVEEAGKQVKKYMVGGADRTAIIAQYVDKLRNYAQKFGKGFDAKLVPTTIPVRENTEFLAKLRARFGEDAETTTLERVLQYAREHGEHTIVGPNGIERPHWMSAQEAQALQNGDPGMIEANARKVWALEISPKLRESAITQGFSLFDAAGVAGSAALLQALQDGGPVNQEVAQLFGVVPPALPGTKPRQEGEPEAEPAGFIDRMMRPFIGKGGRRALEGGLETFESRMLKAPPPPGALEAMERSWAPYKTAPDGGLPAVPLDGIDFNVKNFDTTRGAIEQVNNASKAYEEKITAATRGVAKDDQGKLRRVPQALTRQVADLLGTDPEAAQKAIEKLPVDTQDLHVRATVMRDTLVKMAEDLDRKAMQIQFDPLAVTDAMLLEFRADFARFAAFQAQMKGVQTEIARALAGFRIPAQGEMGALRRAQVASEVLNSTGGRDAALELATRWGMTPPELKGQIVEKGAFAKTRDAIFEVWINGLLSSPRTHEVNFAGTQLFMLWQAPERVVGGMIGKARQLLPNADPDRVYMMEGLAQLHGYLEGIPEAFRLAWGTFKNEMPSDQLTKIEAQQYKAITAQKFGLDEASLFGRFVDLVGQGVRLPGRMLMTADEFNKAQARAMERRAQAYRLSNQALDQGKSTQEAAEAYADVMGGKLADVEQQISAHADIVTFTKELGAKATSFQRFANEVPGMRVIVPFIRTPINIFKQVVERTPVANLALKEVREDLLAGGARRDMALAKMSTGSAALTFAGYLATNDIITGGGPEDANMRRIWLEKYQPYSVNVRRLVGDERWAAMKEEFGLTSEWYPYGRLEPLATLFGAAADFVQFKKWAPADLDERGEASVLAEAFGAVLHNVSEKTFMQGLGDAAAAYHNPERYAGQWLSQMAGSALPFSSALRDIESATDPERRDARPDPSKNPLLQGFYATLNELKGRTPGWSKDLPPQTNFWGEDLKPFGDDWAKNFWAFSPKEGKTSPAIDEILRLRRPPTMPEPEIEGVRLNAWQHYRLKKAMNELADLNPIAGRPMVLKDALDWLVQTNAYQQTLGDERKAAMIKDVVNAYAAAGREAMITPGTKFYDPEVQGLVIGARARKAAGLPANPR